MTEGELPVGPMAGRGQSPYLADFRAFARLQLRQRQTVQKKSSIRETISWRSACR